jgi:ABC-type antimicrobial peptide transport system permease subunit
MRPGLIVLQVTIESALLIGLGVLSGVVLMLVCLAPLSGGVDLGSYASAMSMVGMANVLHPTLNPVDAVVFSTIVWLLGVGAALWPARMAARALPVVAMAETA